MEKRRRRKRCRMKRRKSRRERWKKRRQRRSDMKKKTPGQLLIGRFGPEQGVCVCVCGPTGGGGGVTGSDAAQRAVDHHDVADVDRVVAQVLLPVAVGVLNTWWRAGERGAGSGGQWGQEVSWGGGEGGCNTVVPQQDDVGAAVQLQLLQAVHHLTDEVIKGLQGVPELRRRRREVRGQRSERSERSVAVASPTSSL